MCRKKKNAYMTLEAALLLPLVLGVIVFTIYLGFYFYNASVIRQISYEAALRGSRLRDVNTQQIKLYVEGQIEEMARQKLIGETELNYEIKVFIGEIRVETSLNMVIPVMESFPWGTRLWMVKNEAKVSRADPVKIIRGVRIINESKISE